MSLTRCCSGLSQRLSVSKQYSNLDNAVRIICVNKHTNTEEPRYELRVDNCYRADSCCSRRGTSNVSTDRLDHHATERASICSILL